MAVSPEFSALFMLELLLKLLLLVLYSSCSDHLLTFNVDIVASQVLGYPLGHLLLHQRQGGAVRSPNPR